MDPQPLVSADVLARYAADAARDVEGVVAVADGARHRGRGVVVTTDGDATAVRLHLELEWGRSAPAVGAAVQERVREYLARMVDVRPAAVDVVVSGVGPPAARR